MKIALTVHQFFPENGSGTEVLVLSVAKELMKHGHNVIVFAASPVKNTQSQAQSILDYYYEGIRIKRFKYDLISMATTNKMAMTYDNPICAYYFGLFLETENPDVVHFFHLARLTSSLIPECINRNIPCFFTPTDFWLICPLHTLLLSDGTPCMGPDKNAANCIKHLGSLYLPSLGLFLKKMPVGFFKYATKSLRLISGLVQTVIDSVEAMEVRQQVIINRINQVNVLFAPNLFIANILEKYGVSKQIIRYSPYGLCIEEKEKNCKKFNEKYLQVGFIGNLTREKGVHLLIDAVKALPELAIELKIYGKLESHSVYIQELLRSAQKDVRIKFCGTFHIRNISLIFAGLDVLVVPSLWYENTPLVIYAAQAYGCPVIASNRGTLAEMINHGKNGLLFSPEQANELKQTLSLLNKDLLQELATNIKPPRLINDYVKELQSAYQDSYKLVPNSNNAR